MSSNRIRLIECWIDAVPLRGARGRIAALDLLSA